MILNFRDLFMDPMMHVAIQAIREGGKTILKTYDNNNYIMTSNQKYHMILLNNIIYKAEKKIISVILKFFPKHTILSKKSILYNNKKDITWYIQTINGKDNFIKNFPSFCLSIILYVQNQITFSVIYNPIQNELFTTIKGMGVKLNGYKIRCNSIFNPNNIMISISCLSKTKHKVEILNQLFKKFLTSNIYIRTTGCTILDIAHLCCGKLDYVIDLEYNQHRYNLSKLCTIESGGLIESLKNVIRNNFNGIIYCSNNQYMELLKQLLYN